MANNFRRYQPRRSTGPSSLVRAVLWLLVIGVGIFLVWRLVVGGGRDQAGSKTNEASISLVNDAVTNTTTSPANANLAETNTNTAPAEPEIATVPDGVCSEPISKYGEDKVAVLTFELSAANDNAKQLLQQLQKEKIPASFFSTGVFAEKNPDFVKSVVTAGFNVYNRGYDSTNLTTLTAETIPVQLTKAAVSIEAATGASPLPYLRPAFNATNTTVVKAATEAGYCIILGTVDATDWQDGVTSDAAVTRVMSKLTAGMIIQLHAGYDITAATVTGLVAALKAQGYSLMTIPSLMNS